MIIIIRITGGCIAIPRTITIDTRCLPGTIAASVERQAESCMTTPDAPHDERVRDGRTIHLDVDGRRRTFREPALPGAIAALLRMRDDPPGVSIRHGHPQITTGGVHDGRTTA